MNVGRALTTVLAFAAICLVGASAVAKEVSIKGHSRSDVKSGCSGDGDVGWYSGTKYGTYGCVKADGSGIVCGGYTPHYKKTCSTFREASFPPPKLPTRDDAVKAAEADGPAQK